MFFYKIAIFNYAFHMLTILLVIYTVPFFLYGQGALCFDKKLYALISIYVDIYSVKMTPRRGLHTLFSPFGYLGPDSQLGYFGFMPV